MTIGEKIKQLRKKNKLTQKELAQKIEMSEISIRKYESGDRIPSFEVILKLCNALDVYPQELLKSDQKMLFELIDSLDDKLKDQSDDNLKDQVINSHYELQLKIVTDLFLDHNYLIEYIQENGKDIVEISTYVGEPLAKLEETDFVNRGNELINEIQESIKLQKKQFINRYK